MQRTPTRGKYVFRQIAQLHAECIDQGFLSSLGVPFLTLLYEAIDSESSCVLNIKERQNKVIGFVAGAQGMGPIYRRLLINWPRLFLALLPSIFSFTKMKKIVEIIVLSRTAKPVLHCPRAELLSIAVSKVDRGKGYAETLYESLCENFKTLGVTEFCIVVGDALIPAHRFYRKMGAKVIGTIEVHRGQSSVVYKQDCSS